MAGPSAATEPPGELAETEPARDPALVIGEASTSVSFTAYMAAVATFFAGLLLTQDHRRVAAHLGDLLASRIALTMLFVSALAFLYATMIYANTTCDSALGVRGVPSDVCMAQGNVISEYLGVFSLVFAIPLAVLSQRWMRDTAAGLFVLSLGGFAAYHHLGHSIAERHLCDPSLRGRGRMYAVMIGTIVLGTIQFVAVYDAVPWLAYATSGVLGTSWIALAAHAVSVDRG
jgi:hypothetical protein